MPPQTSVLVLGAGFGGLEFSTRLAEVLGDAVDITLIDRADGFVFGFSKFDLLFQGKPLSSVQTRYSELVRPQVHFRQETITAIDPANKSVTTDGGTYSADVMLVALGAEYDFAATPGLEAAGSEFYSVPGALRLAEKLSSFRGGATVVGVCGPSFKCPPAPSECSLLLDEYLRQHGIRDASSVTLVMPFGQPLPPSPETSRELLERFAQRGITFVGDRTVASVEPGSVVLSDGSRLPCDLFFGVPVHRAPDVIRQSPLADDGWIAVDKATLATKFPDVYAVGDVTSVGTAKAGVFAEGAARVVADQLIARLRSEELPPGYDGTAACYIEFGGQAVGRVQVDFFSVPGQPQAAYTSPSPETKEEKAQFSVVRKARWFGA